MSASRAPSPLPYGLRSISRASASARSRAPRGQFGRRQLKRRQALARIVPSCKGDGLQGALANRLARLGRQPCAERAADQAQAAPIRVRR